MRRVPENRWRLAVACSQLVADCRVRAMVAQFIDAKLDYRVTTSGKIRQVITNMGTFDKGRTGTPA